MIYFLRIDSGERVGTTKVGTSTNVGIRAASIAARLNSTVSLRYVMAGGFREETFVHAKLRESRVLFGAEREFFLTDAAESFAESRGAKTVGLTHTTGSRDTFRSLISFDSSAAVEATLRNPTTPTDPRIGRRPLTVAEFFALDLHCADARDACAVTGVPREAMDRLCRGYGQKSHAMALERWSLLLGVSMEAGVWIDAARTLNQERSIDQ